MTDPASEPTQDVRGTGDELQLVSDGDGLVVIGNLAVVERFLVSQGLDRASSRTWAPPRSGAHHAGRDNPGRHGNGRLLWTLDPTHRGVRGSCIAVRCMLTKTPGSATRGDRRPWIDPFPDPDPRQDLGRSSPIRLFEGTAGIMAQAAMWQIMEDITDYLAVIDEKVDDILRAQKDGVLADMIGVDFVIEEAMTIRDQVGRVGEVTWSKVQGTSLTIARTQAYAVRQLDALVGEARAQRRRGELGQACTRSQDQQGVVEGHVRPGADRAQERGLRPDHDEPRRQPANSTGRQGLLRDRRRRLRNHRRHRAEPPNPHKAKDRSNGTEALITHAPLRLQRDRVEDVLLKPWTATCASSAQRRGRARRGYANGLALVDADREGRRAAESRYLVARNADDAGHPGPARTR